jgi:adenine C2-methylase RlmN of 23S rRNA A2503 and tRNA A37
MKCIEAVNTLNALSKVSEDTTIFPVKVGYLIIKNVNDLKSALNSYADMRNSIVKKYDSNNTGEVKKDDPNYAQCLKDMTELNAQEINITLTKIKLADIEDMKLPMNILNNLSCMIE